MKTNIERPISVVDLCIVLDVALYHERDHIASRVAKRCTTVLVLVGVIESIIASVKS